MKNYWDGLDDLVSEYKWQRCPYCKSNRLDAVRGEGIQEGLTALQCHECGAKEIHPTYNPVIDATAEEKRVGFVKGTPNQHRCAERVTLTKEEVALWTEEVRSNLTERDRKRLDIQYEADGTGSYVCGCVATNVDAGKRVCFAHSQDGRKAAANAAANENHADQIWDDPTLTDEEKGVEYQKQREAVYGVDPEAQPLYEYTVEIERYFDDEPDGWPLGIIDEALQEQLMQQEEIGSFRGVFCMPTQEHDDNAVIAAVHERLIYRTGIDIQSLVYNTEGGDYEGDIGSEGVLMLFRGKHSGVEYMLNIKCVARREYPVEGDGIPEMDTLDFLHEHEDEETAYRLRLLHTLETLTSSIQKQPEYCGFGGYEPCTESKEDILAAADANLEDYKFRQEAWARLRQLVGAFTDPEGDEELDLIKHHLQNDVANVKALSPDYMCEIEKPARHLLHSTIEDAIAKYERVTDLISEIGLMRSIQESGDRLYIKNGQCMNDKADGTTQTLGRVDPEYEDTIRTELLKYFPNAE